jgi:hypothetical protein
MGVLFMDSFDHYTTPGHKWVASGGDIGAYGRNGTNGIRIQHSSTNIARTCSNKGTLYLGVAAIFAAGQAGPVSICGFGDAGTNQVHIEIEPGNKIRAYRQNIYNVLVTSDNPVQNLDVYHYYEVKVVFSTSVGQIIVKVDGVEYINTSANLNTSASGNAYANNYWIGYGLCDWWNNRYYDDFWIADDQFYGDCRIQAISPTGAGNYAQWTPSAGSNWDCVEEKPPSTSEYISSGTVGQIDTYATGDVTPTAGTVVAVQGNFYCQKSDAGNRSIALATRLSSTDDVGSTLVLPSSWGYMCDIKTTKPGGGAWTISDVNSAEFGVKMVA